MKFHRREAAHPSDDLHEFREPIAFVLPPQIGLPEVSGKQNATSFTHPCDDRIQFMEGQVRTLVDDEVKNVIDTVIKKLNHDFSIILRD